MAKMALIKFYARLIRNGQMKEEELPADLREQIMEAYKELPPLEDDPAQSSAQ